MSANNNKYQANMICDLQEYIEGYQIISISIGADNGYYVLAVNNVPKRIDGMFQQTQTSTQHDYKVITVQYDNVYTVNIDNQEWNYHFVQPIGDSNILLVCARSRYYGHNKYDLNGKIFDLNGNLIKEFLLGDGIQDVKVSSGGIIWTSYFDEGVFGNYGWDNPIGSCGLRAWNQNGETVYIYNNDGNNFICDCYALNIVSDNEVWFYYYTDFLLGKIKDGKVDYFDPKLSGADGFLTYDRYVLFRGGYSNRDEYHLFEFIKTDTLQEKKIITFTNENNEEIQGDSFDCRGSKLLLRSDTKLYDVDIMNIVYDI
ncbi:MAG: hypothetical protein N2645_15165 [Clostridia bacterium]|nr:hypothetical protein [Clostridia bacterium]